jgi:hypothetical protein
MASFVPPGSYTATTQDISSTTISNINGVLTVD